MQVAILAGGMAVRLGSLTKGQPKSMVRVLGKPFLEYQLEFLRRADIEDVVLCIGHLGKQIQDYFGNGRRFDVNIKYSIEHQPLGTAGGLVNAEPLLDDVFFTLYGDSYIFLDYGIALSYFESRSKLALMTVYKNCNRYDRSNTAVDEELVVGFSKGEKSRDMVYIEYGANIFKKKALEMIPKDRFFSLEDLFPSLIENGQILAFEVKKRFYEIGSPRGLKEFEEYLLGVK